MSSRKEIWLPVTETHVTVTSEGKVSLHDQIVMQLVPVKKQTGFEK